MKLVFLEKMKNTLEKVQYNLQKTCFFYKENIDSEQSPLAIHTHKIFFRIELLIIL